MSSRAIALVISGCLLAACAGATPQDAALAFSHTADPARPFRGPIRPDLPLARGYNDAARALAYADDNPLIRWAYRVWCETGYRSPEDAGAGQEVDELIDPAQDLVSPQGFFHSRFARTPMPSGGARFLDNAWYFGADGLGVIVVRTPDGLLMVDTMTTPEEFEQVVLSEMPAAGLNPADIRYVFLGHMHADHTGGANVVQRLAPEAKVVMGAPDAAIVDQAREALRNGETPPPGATVRWRSRPTDAAEAAALHQTRLRSVPNRIDMRIEPEPGQTTGSARIRIGPSTEVVAVLNPGHTPGQMSVIIPVQHQGETRQLLVLSGNDNPDEAAQYARSMDYLRSVAAQVGADTLINTHGYQSAMFYHLRRLQADPSASNPFAMGRSGVDRFLGVFAECQRATHQRLEDGTWLAF
ncbi:MAG TPA: MBL fold metallo-hydrolase [Vitreimonas sp.]|uniref:MBL fold metallo-hydrolase n=1 Tax=Vitreimonas sp. TaxID=3069702 RepID=UPI002D70FCB1|nr:MBL fold metallo-hydrolase [Vitreimonas sp.]HYD89260.1 MBL fold metallo-hydrolase [Vitreimonas sp.]